MTTSTHHCRICEVDGEFDVHYPCEMMFGTREVFEYFQCSNCGCLQISQIPRDIGRHYPATYYSFRRSALAPMPPPLRLALEKWRIGNTLFGKYRQLSRVAGNLVAIPTELGRLDSLLKKCRLESFSARFLDVGCGSSSAWLRDLRRLGFTNLIGADAFIEKNVVEDTITILKKPLDELQGKFDVITLHHSLEHMPEQRVALAGVRSLLAKSGVCVVRIPLVSSTVWETYGTDWVELDAPRHLYLHSLKSIKHVGQQAGLRLVENWWDSEKFEFFGSEQYRRGIPLTDECSHWKGAAKSGFTYREMWEFERLAEQANAQGKGGRGVFLFVAQ